MNYSMKFELKDDKEKKVIWSGTIEMKVPLNHERLANVARAGGHKLAGLRKMDLKSEAGQDSLFSEKIPILAAIYGHARELILGVNLKSVDGEEITTKEAFETHPDLTNGFMAVATQYMQGFGPGKI